MQYDLKLIKKHYGEDMAHLCRDLFPTLLEKEGLLISLIESKFAHSRSLCQDIIEEGLSDEFKDFIYSLTAEKEETIDTGKTVETLMNEAGYTIYECTTEEEIQSFKKYYKSDEQLCTFNGGRLRNCRVFFAIKKNVDEIKRKDFTNPRRQDEYGTSVISIQFTRGKNNTLSIKNRYNHAVTNPDATFNNNLENIIPGLTKAFEKQYGFKINQNAGDFKIPYYVIAGDGKFYEYNHELNNTYYGPNNIIIDKFEVKEKFLDKSRYIIIDILVLDIKEKKLYLYNPTPYETLPEFIGKIEKINITNLEEGKKQICIINDKGEDTYITLDDKNRIIGFVNNYIEEIDDRFFMHSSHKTVYFEARNLKKIGDGFLNGGAELKQFIAPNLREVGIGFLAFNSELEILDCPLLEKVGYNFLSRHPQFKIDNFDKRVTLKSKVKFVKVLARNKIYNLYHNLKH